VIVYFHGGSFILSGYNNYGGQHYLEQDVVLVMPHYRLGPLGFMCLKDEQVGFYFFIIVAIFRLIFYITRVKNNSF